MSKGEKVTFNNCRVLAVSKAAIQVDNGCWDKPIWFPDSQIDDDSELYLESEVGDTGKLVVTEWIAEQKGVFDLND